MKYEIIIPKEELKQQTLEEAKKQQFKYDNLQEAKEISSRIKVVETLEEAAERLTQDYNSNISNKLIAKTFITVGAKWQQKNSYSEEEVYIILNNFGNKVYGSYTRNEMMCDFVEKWFEQFKNIKWKN
jgi:hypothetical protein